MKQLILILALVGICSAQTTRFSTDTGTVALAGAGATFTIQQPSTGERSVTLETATVYCSVACVVTQSQNGTAATATAAVPKGLAPFGWKKAAATVWTASNVGAGTAVGPTLNIPAGGTVVLDLSKIQLNTGTASNYSITISSITGNYSINLIHSEL